MSDDAPKKAEQEALTAKAKGTRHQQCSQTALNGSLVNFSNEALANSNEVMNTLASPDAPPPPPKKPKA